MLATLVTIPSSNVLDPILRGKSQYSSLAFCYYDFLFQKSSKLLASVFIYLSSSHSG